METTSPLVHTTRKSPDPQLVGTRAIVRVQKQDLRHRVAKPDRLEPTAQPDQVPGVHRTPRPRACRASTGRNPAEPRAASTRSVEMKV